MPIHLEDSEFLSISNRGDKLYLLIQCFFWIDVLATNEYGLLIRREIALMERQRREADAKQKRSLQGFLTKS